MVRIENEIKSSLNGYIFFFLSVLPIDKKDNYEEDIDIGIFTVVIGNIRPT